MKKFALKSRKNPKWRQRYEELCEELKDRRIVNNWIEQYVMKITGMKSVRQVEAKRSKIIGSYSKLTP